MKMLLFFQDWFFKSGGENPQAVEILMGINPSYHLFRAENSTGWILTARSIDLKARPVMVHGPELSLGFGPLHA